MATARRTQSERRAATRRALLDAAVESLIDRGWGATTAVEVCARANVTRGALAHHFPDLGALLAEALREVLGQLDDGHPLPTTLVGLVDATWRAIGSRPFKAVIEALLAMANAPDLRPDLEPVVAGFAKLVNPDELDVPALGRADARLFYRTAREAMLGLALGRAMNRGTPLGHEAAVIERLRREARTFDRRAATSKRRP